MAELYVAAALGPEGFKKPVVIKRLLPHLAERPELVDMFLDEARLAAQLQHPNIVQIFDLGREGEDFFLCMEHLQGEDLAAIIQKANASGAPIPVEIVAQISGCVADGQQYAHHHSGPDGEPRSVLHGDISPSNVMITFVGEVKLVDFGIARAADALPDGASPLNGKLGYLAPEQLRGARGTPRAEVFSLGVVMHELLTGRRLFHRDSPEATRSALLDQPIPDPRTLRADVPAALAEIVMAALAREPERRIGSAAALRERLEEFLASRQHLATSAGLSSWLTQLFGPEHISRARPPLPLEPTGPVTNVLEPSETSSKKPLVPLVAVPARSRSGAFVRVVGEVPAALVKAGASVVAVPAQLAAFAMRWTRPRIVAAAALVALVGFGIGLAARELREAAAHATATPPTPPPGGPTPPLLAQALAREPLQTPLPGSETKVVDPAPEENVSKVETAKKKRRRLLTSGRRLVLPPGRGLLEISVRGVVLVQGRRVGRAPLKRILPEGTYDVTLVDESGKPVRHWTAVVRPGHTTQLSR